LAFSMGTEAWVLVSARIRSVNGVEGLIPTDECLEAHMVASSELQVL